MICCLFEDVQIREGNIVTRRRDFWTFVGIFSPSRDQETLGSRVQGFHVRRLLGSVVQTP